jgi:hypothetical protein
LPETACLLRLISACLTHSFRERKPRAPRTEGPYARPTQARRLDSDQQGLRPPTALRRGTRNAPSLGPPRADTGSLFPGPTARRWTTRGSPRSFQTLHRVRLNRAGPLRRLNSVGSVSPYVRRSPFQVEASLPEKRNSRTVSPSRIPKARKTTRDAQTLTYLGSTLRRALPS